MYNPENFSCIYPRNEYNPTGLYFYNDFSEDDLATILTDGYFNDVNITTPGTLEINDQINIIGTDGFVAGTVTAITPNIIVV